MKINELRELRKKDGEELVKLISDKKKKLQTAKIQIKAGREKNLKLARNISREIAKILTIVKESQIMAKESGKTVKK